MTVTKSNSTLGKICIGMMTVATLVFIGYVGFQFGVWLKG